jgi:hypothetical protein
MFKYLSLSDVRDFLESWINQLMYRDSLAASTQLSNNTVLGIRT